mmetsp:Transcript_31177/g.99024  ORF Transcript_31177/g.99024 Transcript_31177/m.99024 type:complete len:203 (+) Transcript_31177:62-670(+)
MWMAKNKHARRGTPPASPSLALSLSLSLSQFHNANASLRGLLGRRLVGGSLLGRGILVGLGRDAELQEHGRELLEVDGAVAVGVELIEHVLDGGLVDVVVAAVLLRRLLRQLGRLLDHVRDEVALEAPGHLVHEVFRGEAVRPGHVACALAVGEGVVAGAAHLRRVGHDQLLVGGVERGGVLHGAHERLHHAERVEGRLLTG